MGWTRKRTNHVLDRFRAVLPSRRRPRLGSGGTAKWPATIIEDLRRLASMPYDEIDPQSDWLARFVKKGRHGED